MDNRQKKMAMTGVCVGGVIGVVLLVKAARHWRQMGVYEKVGSGIEERLRESKLALDNATAHIQRVFDHIKNHKR